MFDEAGHLCEVVHLGFSWGPWLIFSCQNMAGSERSKTGSFLEYMQLFMVSNHLLGHHGR